MTSNHLTIYVSKLLVHFEFKVRINVVSRAKKLIFLINMASCHFGCFLTPKIPIFGPTWTWNGTWMGHKSVQHIFPHCLGCVLTHFPVSRCVIGLIWQPSIMVYFNPKKGHFWTTPELEWDQERS